MPPQDSGTAETFSNVQPLSNTAAETFSDVQPLQAQPLSGPVGPTTISAAPSFMAREEQLHPDKLSDVINPLTPLKKGLDTLDILGDAYNRVVQQGTPEGEAEHPAIAKIKELGRNLEEFLSGGQAAGKPMGTSGGALDVAQALTLPDAGVQGAEFVTEDLPKAINAYKDYKKAQAVARGETEVTDAFTKLLKQAIPPSRYAPWDAADVARIKQPLLDMHEREAVAEPDDLVKAMTRIVDHNENRMREMIATDPNALIKTNPIDAVRQALKDDPDTTFLQRGLKSLERFELGFERAGGIVDPPLTWQKADDLRWKLNQLMASVRQEHNWDDARALATDPGYAAARAAVDALRDGAYQVAADHGFTEAAEMRKTEGSAIRIREAAARQKYNAEKKVSGTGKGGAIRKAVGAGVRATGALGGAAVGNAVGGPVGAGFGAAMGTGIAEPLARLLGGGENLTRGTLIENAMETARAEREAQLQKLAKAITGTTQSTAEAEGATGAKTAAEATTPEAITPAKTAAETISETVPKNGQTTVLEPSKLEITPEGTVVKTGSRANTRDIFSAEKKLIDSGRLNEGDISRLRSAAMDQYEAQGRPTNLFEDFYAQKLRQATSIPLENTEIAQGGHAGGGVASVEELNRAGRFVKVSRSGQLTDQGKVPDFTLKAGEAGYHVKPDGTYELKAGQETPATKAGVEKYAKEVFSTKTATKSTPQDIVEKAGGIFRGNKGGMVEITLPREMVDKLPIQDRMKDFVSITLPEDKISLGEVKNALHRKFVEMGGKPEEGVEALNEKVNGKKVPLASVNPAPKVETQTSKPKTTLQKVRDVGVGAAVLRTGAQIYDDIQNLQNDEDKSEDADIPDNSSSDTSAEAAPNIPDILDKAAKDNKIPPSILHAQADQESKSDPDAVSSKGAVGVLQLMPRTARALGVTDPTDPEQNAEGAAAYMSALHHHFKSWDKTLAAYNWGPDNVQKAIDKYGDKWLEHAPKETQTYVRKILRRPK